MSAIVGRCWTDGCHEPAKAHSPPALARCRRTRNLPAKAGPELQPALPSRQKAAITEVRSRPRKFPPPNKPLPPATRVPVSPAACWRESAPAFVWLAPGGRRRPRAANAKREPCGPSLPHSHGRRRTLQGGAAARSAGQRRGCLPAQSVPVPRHEGSASRLRSFQP